MAQDEHMSDFSDCDMEDDALEHNFTAATEHIQRIHDSLAPDDLLQLYALYKQATVGRCNTVKPNIFNMQGRAKWTAWQDLGDMNNVNAKTAYVDKVKQLDAKWYEKLQSGEKIKSVNSWVVHSIELPPNDEVQKAEHEKNLFDFVKENNIERLTANLTKLQLNVTDENGMGLIHWATDRNAHTILDFLLKFGADVNLRDAEQQTALHYAAECGHMECTRLLLSYNADRSLKDAEGHTCVDIADNEDIRVLLS